MLREEILIKNESGLHAKVASMLVELCNKYNSDIRIYANDMIIDGKSIISILLGKIYKDTLIKLEVEGEDEKQAFEAIVKYLKEVEE